MNLVDEFRWRGLLHEATEGAEEAFASEPRTVYIGFDPTADSLHVGSLIPVMGLVHAQRAGHTPIALVGGGTGLIGDPSGKADERALMTPELVARHSDAIRGQLESFLDFEGALNPARMVNNLDWLQPIRTLDFLRDVGKHFSVNALLRKESIRRRVESDESGLSFTEFAYLLLQAYDFLELHRRHGCTAQMGGSDQWGNITAGIDLIRRVEGRRAYGVVYPLMVTSSGTKFGKTEAGTVWLDPERTSPYRFYQFWLNTGDEDVVHYLRSFTLLSADAIAELASSLAERPQERAAQRALADDVTRRVHGEDGLGRARAATDVLFGGSLDGLSASEIADIFADVPSVEIRTDELAGEGLPLIDALVQAGAATSRGDARRSIEGGGIYVNNARVTDVDARVAVSDAIEGRFLVLRKGKKRYYLVELAV